MTQAVGVESEIIPGNFARIGGFGVGNFVGRAETGQTIIELVGKEDTVREAQRYVSENGHLDFNVKIPGNDPQQILSLIGQLTRQETAGLVRQEDNVYRFKDWVSVELTTVGNDHYAIITIS